MWQGPGHFTRQSLRRGDHTRGGWEGGEEEEVGGVGPQGKFRNRFKEEKRALPTAAERASCVRTDIIGLEGWRRKRVWRGWPGEGRGEAES